MSLGQLHNVWSVVKNEENEKLKSFRKEAAWKLCKWDDVEELSKESSNDWNSCLCRIFAGLKKQNDIREELNKTRSALMAPLSAASLEQGSYQRSYEILVRLHMLTEIERFSSSFKQVIYEVS